MDPEKRSWPLELPSFILLPAILILGLLLRLYAGRNTLQGGNVLFVGFDEFYHMRRILYTVAHFPNTLWFDSYIDYPHGYNNTWPPLFDQLLAAVSLAFGQHSQHGIELVSATVPAFIGSIAIVAVYYMVKEIFDRKAAIMSAFMTALAPYYVQKSMLGETDHHSLEVLLLIFAIMFLVLALSKKERRHLFAVAAGVSMAGLAYTWIGSSAYFGMILIYALVQMTLDLKNGVSSEETVTTLLTALGVTLAFTLPFWNTPWLSPSFFGTLAIMVAIIASFAIARLVGNRKIHWAAFPIAVAALGPAFVLFLNSLGLFAKVNSLTSAGIEELFGGGMIGKISEAEPLFTRPEIFFSSSILSNLGWNLVLSVIGLALLISYLWHSWQGTEKRESKLLFLVFAVYTLIITVGQIRFLYLSSITMGILITILFFRVEDYASEKAAGLGQLPRLSFIALLFILLVLPTTFEAIGITDVTPQIAGDWYNTLNWLDENSNTTSWYDNPDKTPEYSVLSWWDYGNWILYQAKRPVVSNNFQTGIEDASKFYLSEDEKTATDILDARRTKYVITDYDMLYGKLPAIALWANKDPSEYQSSQDLGNYLAVVPTKKLYQTTLALLHFIDGSSLGHFRLIYESHTIVGQNPPTSSLKIFEYVPGALIRVSNAPGKKVVTLLNMTSNQGRKFIYVNEGTSEVRVPYSTEKRYGTYAITPYLVVSGNNSTNMRRQSINVTEDDVQNGKVLEVTM
ncbi:MAG: oligosaccharyl transferase, archaeosortase A system-associated [Methanotrichaceae archaeon]|jgi:dolichyl-diphosphooligosaccharide--protein glycosyltransferase